MMVRRDVFDLLGGFDEDFFMFYEDVDFGWRLNLLGWRFRYEPSSIAYHRHHGTVAKFGSFKERYLLERNALFCIYKNLEQSRLDEALPAALTLAIRRAVSEAGLDSPSYDFRSGADDLSADQVVPRETLATVFAIDQFVEHLPALMRKRRAVQASRRKADADVWTLFGRVDAIAGDATYREGHENIAQAFGVTDAPQKRKVLIITGDPIGAKMAGPAIRAWHMAEALTELNDVVLMTMSRLEDIDAPFRLTRVRAGDNRSFEPWSKWADVIVFQGHALSVFPALGESNAVVIADIYDPMHLEQLEQAKALPVQTWEKQVEDATSVLNDQMERADFLLCASERQRQFYLGQLAALGRLNPATYADDSSLRRLIDVAPFGLDSTPPVHDRGVLKGIQPGIGADDKLLRVLPWAELDVISVTPAMAPNARSSGVATVAAMVSGLAPGRLALTEMVGYSTWGRGATGSKKYAHKPASTRPSVKSAVAMGRAIKGAERFMGIQNKRYKNNSCSRLLDAPLRPISI